MTQLYILEGAASCSPSSLFIATGSYAFLSVLGKSCVFRKYEVPGLWGRGEMEGLDKINKVLGCVLPRGFLYYEGYILL